MIKRIPGRSFGDAYGNISQSIKAADFRGQKIRFTAAVRIEKGTGYLWLSINGGPRGKDMFHQEIITSDTWQEYHIDTEVPQGASKITYGLAYVGQGTACIDEVIIH